MSVTCRDGEEYRFGVKPDGGSLSVDLEKWHGMKEPSGLIGHFLKEKSYRVDDNGNIHTRLVEVPFCIVCLKNKKVAFPTSV